MAEPADRNPYESPRTERPRPEETAVRPRRLWFYRPALPFAWLLVTIVSWNYPGDEYGLFLASALPAIWVAPLLSYLHISEVLWSILPAGFLTMLLLGWALDALRVRRSAWIAAVLAIAIGLVLLGLWEFPTYQRAIAKNGSLTAYVAAGLSLGLLLATIFGIVVTPVWRGLVRLLRSR